jgi:hypothetical protein
VTGCARRRCGEVERWAKRVEVEEIVVRAFE